MIHQRDGAVVVPVEHRRFPLRILSNPVGNLPILIGPPRHRFHPNSAGRLRRGLHVFIVSLSVVPDKTVRQSHDVLSGPVVGLQPIHFTPGIMALKIQQGLRVRRPKTVDALIFIPHHEQISPVLRENLQNPMLQPRGILRLVHHHIGIFPPVMTPHPRHLLQEFAGIHQLIVVVHGVLRLHAPDVSVVQGLRRVISDSKLLNLPLRKPHILDIGNLLRELPNVALPGKRISRHAHENPAQKQPGVRQVFRFLPSRFFRIKANYAVAEAVDGHKIHPIISVLPPEPLLHFLRRIVGKSNYQHGGVRHSGTKQVLQAGQKRGGFPTSWHSKKQRASAAIRCGRSLLFV